MYIYIYAHACMFIFHVTKHPLGVTAMTGPKMSWPLGQILIGNLWSCDKAGAEFGRCRQCQLNVCGSITYKYIFWGWDEHQFTSNFNFHLRIYHGWCHARDRLGQRMAFAPGKNWWSKDGQHEIPQCLQYRFFWLEMWRICTKNKVPSGKLT